MHQIFQDKECQYKAELSQKTTFLRRVEEGKNNYTEDSASSSAFISL